jgi:hypothetical protein
MNANIRCGSAVAALVILVGCAGTGAGMKANDGKSAAAAKNPDCLTGTGSRLPVHDPNCSVYGRSYTSEDISRTGAGSTTTAGALPLLDPSITIHH